jgi:hypothetical protein
VFGGAQIFAEATGTVNATVMTQRWLAGRNYLFGFQNLRRRKMMSTSYKTKLTLMAAVSGLMFAASVMADESNAIPQERTSRAAYQTSVNGANLDYKTAAQGCPAAKGPERTDCRKQARATRDVALADARTKHGMKPFDPSYPMQSKIPN